MNKDKSSKKTTKNTLEIAKEVIKKYQDVIEGLKDK